MEKTDLKKIVSSLGVIFVIGAVFMLYTSFPENQENTSEQPEQYNALPETMPSDITMTWSKVSSERKGKGPPVITYHIANITSTGGDYTQQWTNNGREEKEEHTLTFSQSNLEQVYRQLQNNSFDAITTHPGEKGGDIVSVKISWDEGKEQRIIADNETQDIDTQWVDEFNQGTQRIEQFILNHMQ